MQEYFYLELWEQTLLHLKRNLCIFIQENAFENAVCKTIIKEFKHLKPQTYLSKNNGETSIFLLMNILFYTITKYPGPMYEWKI